MTDTK
jgi:hypothetical protein